MNKKIITFFIFVFFSIIYFYFSFSKVSFGDCIGFVLDVEKRTFLTEATPLSHFLYINTAIFFTKYFNIDSVMVMRLMSVLPAAATIALIYVLIKEFLQENWIAIMASFVFGFSFTFWRSASTVEVYTFNAFWVVLFLVSAVKSLRSNSKIHLVLSGVFLGLSLWVHIQNIMLIPAFLYIIYLKLKSDQKYAMLSLLSFSLIFLLIFVYNYNSGISPKYAFMSKTGPWVENTFTQSFMDLIKAVVKAILFLLYNFNIFVVFLVTGIFVSFKKQDITFRFLYIAMIFTFGFATFYAVTDNYVFFIPAYLVFCVFIAKGIEMSRFKKTIKKLSFATFLIPLIYVVAVYAVSFTSPGKKLDNEKSYKGGLTYYMLPWLIDNKGCLEFALDPVKTLDNTEALEQSSLKFIELRKKYQNLEDIKKL